MTNITRTGCRTKKLTLLEELLSHFLTPLFAQLPGSAGVADVRTLQSHLYGVGIKTKLELTVLPETPKLCVTEEVTDLQDEVTVAGVAQAQVLLVQVHAESRQVLILSADVRGQD